MNYKATRRIQFCAGHRVMEHGSKCRHIHGHNYVAFITATARDLDELGMVIDFAVLKQVVGGWIDACWDHGFVVYDKDYAALHALSQFELRETADLPGFMQKVYRLPYNPTAENMARYLLSKANELLMATNVKVVEVTLWETENCYATVAFEAPRTQLTYEIQSLDRKEFERMLEARFAEIRDQVQIRRTPE